MTAPDDAHATLADRAATAFFDLQDRITRALEGLGFPEVLGVRVGKVLDLDLDGLDRGLARRRIDEMCARLLVNPVVEEFTVEVLGE